MNGSPISIGAARTKGSSSAYRFHRAEQTLPVVERSLPFQRSADSITSTGGRLDRADARSSQHRPSIVQVRFKACTASTSSRISAFSASLISVLQIEGAPDVALFEDRAEDGGKVD